MNRARHAGTLDCEEMKENIANVIEIDMGRVNIKATTTEKLGSIGRSEGIASQAVVTLEKMN